jgi:hypothetical protein
MKKIIISVVAAITLILILKQSGVFDALLFFILVGALPGTDRSLSPTTTFAILTVCAALVITNMALPLLNSLTSTIKNNKKSITPQKKYTPRRRFSEI